MRLVPPKSVKAIKALADGRHAVGHVRGLNVQKDGDAQSWILCYTHPPGSKRQREMGLGSLREVTLAEAIEAANDARELIRKRIDPIEDRRQRDENLADGLLKKVTFAVAAKQYITKHGPSWRNAKHRAQWSATLRDYAEPTLGKLPVDRITTMHVVACLEPIWTTKTETATRVRQRIESVLDFCTTARYRSGDNPARWNGHLENLLPAPSKITKVEHHAALAWADLPTFMQTLREAEGMGARALEFAIYTAARSGEVRGATWSEIDLDAATWTVSAERMKAGKEHVVPLSRPALALLRALPRFARCDYVFPSPTGKMLSDMTLTAVMRRLKADAVPHGFRSSFRDWAAERTSYAREVCEMALAHTIPSAVEAAYRRGDLLAKRTRLMRDWATFLVTPPAQGNVTDIRAKAR